VIIAPNKKIVNPRMIGIHGFVGMSAEAISGDMSSNIVATDATLVYMIILAEVRAEDHEGIPVHSPFFVLEDIC